MTVQKNSEKGRDETRQEERGKDHNLPLAGNGNVPSTAISEGQAVWKQGILIHLLELHASVLGLGKVRLLSGA